MLGMTGMTTSADGCMAASAEDEGREMRHTGGVGEKLNKKYPHAFLEPTGPVFKENRYILYIPRYTSLFFRSFGL